MLHILTFLTVVALCYVYALHFTVLTEEWHLGESHVVLIHYLDLVKKIDVVSLMASTDGSK